MSLRDKNALVVTGPVPAKSARGLRDAARQTVARPTNAGLEAMKQASSQLPTFGHGNLGFLIDATASRQSTWTEAQEIQAKMFENTSSYGGLRLKLVHFGGKNLTQHAWEKNPKTVAAAMSEVNCFSGNTKIIEGLKVFLNDDLNLMANCIILIGDAFEEGLEDLERVAEVLVNNRIKVFSFLENDDPNAGRAFKMLAEMTGGVFAKFGKDMPLADLCEGVARLTVGGAPAMCGFQNLAVKNLLLAGPKS